MMALEVENPLPLRLPAGIVTVYDATRGHAGDAMMPELAPGDSALVEFAEDTAVTIREDRNERRPHHRGQPDRWRGCACASAPSDHQLPDRRRKIEDTPRRLTLLHPRRAGWDMQTTGGTAELDATRFTIDAANTRSPTFDVVETRTTRTELALLDLSAEDLAYWEGRDARCRHPRAVRAICARCGHEQARPQDRSPAPVMQRG